MKFRIALCLLASLFISSNLLAHGSGHAPISEQKALLIATQITKGFANVDPQLGFGKVPGSWANIASDAATIFESGDGYRIVKVVNPNEESALYILMSDEGEVYDANISGKFEGVN
ncbi:hypothetical protein DOK_15039 [gamma proteobacterium BDW918]|jgi:hypothetical protein|uniref:PepSY domain-containing protein n=1 Tax=Zhongshania aliphaticivorans TaxID=1470434 RepID=A0A127M8R8_9GAMM|nr:DUF6488 family protein [Zhongshania aliphaticivorans]AMO69620.1 hypothetical protein AZF00_15535 [Zhongshania aliphaticivorans]EIF42281.1 hypothetical protein DOK_15039 [gamma proteobacterium BDW918]